VPLERNDAKEAVRVEVSAGAGPREVRYLRVHAKNRGPLPDWHPGSPENAWLFVDEIVVEGE
jgi:hypothetical protein